MLTALVLLCSIGTTDCGNIAEAPDQTELPFMCLKIRPRGSGQTSGAGRQIRQGAVRAQERAPDYRVVAAWSGFLAFIGAGAFALGMAIHNEATAKPPALHSAGPAHNLERIFYAILRLKAGRSEIVATKSVGELFGHQTAEAKATSEPIVACTHLSTVRSQTASSKTRSAKVPVHPLLVDREGPRKLALQRANVLASSERISHYE
jgi:hypothetical protein